MTDKMRVSHVINRLEQQLSTSKVLIEAYDNFIKADPVNITNQRISSCLSSLKLSWDQFNIINDAIMIAITKTEPNERDSIYNHAYFKTHSFITTRERYFETIEKLNSHFNSYQEPSTTSTLTQSVFQPSSIPTSVQHTRLPEISIPKFSGLPNEWLSFKDFFLSIVGNNSRISAVEKLQYLKASLTGSAALLLKNTSVTADNFQKAWDSLVLFYENKRLLVNDSLQSLLFLKRMIRDSASELEHLYSSINQIYRTLETLGRPVEHWDDFLVFIVAQRLDAESLKAWEHKLGSSKDPPTWAQFNEFLFSRLLSLQAFEKSRHGKALNQTRIQPATAKVHHQGKSKNSVSVNQPSCAICKEHHYTSSCPQYLNKTIQQKLNIITKNKLCYNCLGRHKVVDCRVTTRCLKCAKKHHTTIHQNKSNPPMKKETPNTKEESSTNKSTDAKVLHSSINKPAKTSQVLLATAKVTLVSEYGETTQVRALIDQGSEVSIIRNRIVQRLRLKRKHSSSTLIGIGDLSNKTKGITSFTLKPHFESDVEYKVTAQILSKLTSSIPSKKVDLSLWPHLEKLKLADPEFKQPRSIDLILGADMYCHIIEEGIVRGTEHDPIAQCTTLGWIVSGPVSNLDMNIKAQGYHVKVEENLHDLLKRFWETEEIPNSKTVTLTPDEQECEDHFMDTHCRDASGRYVVRLPFKDSTDKLGNSKIKATKVLNSLNHRFLTNPDLAKLYKEFIHEYEELNHMVRVPNSQPEPDRVYYLPHHGVFRENSLTTKLRVVFNGSSNTTTGVSLNQLLHSGANLQLNLFDVLIWFRLHCYVFFADIEKMYRQILIHPDDWNYQRILWMDQLLKTIIIFALITVAYGLTCAPFLALRSFIQLIRDEGHRFPLALPTVKKGRYMDDFFGGADTVREAELVVQQVDHLCMAGGFPLRKWISNNSDILKFIPLDHRIDVHSIQIDDSTLVHALGLCWQPSTDQFHFTLNLTTPSIITKRTVLSTVAKLFDPLGLLSPIIISAKIFIQELWANGLGWDDELPPPFSNKWIKFMNQLQEMPNFTFPRWLGFQTTDDLEIHGFSDASSKAIAAVVFIRSVSKEGYVTVQLVASKTKVAPLKKLTIPRLELAAAVLLVKLIVQILSVLERHGIPIFGWIDSEVARTWITNHPSRWKEFVQNRVCFIQETLPQVLWKLTPGNQNPADLATRGLSPAQLMEHVEWWTGPQWLRQDASTWPQESKVLSHKDNLEERLTQVAVGISVRSENPWDLLNRYSNFTRLLRITVWCSRIIARFRKSSFLSITDLITTQELERAKLYWVKAVQKFSFNTELNLISNGQPLPKSNSLVRLTPFIDPSGLLRVGGRLKFSLLPPEAKHPLILPRNSPLSSLIIADAHSRTMHGGTQLTLSFIRNEYWIIGGRAPVRSLILKCVKCARYRPLKAQQLMGQLPTERITPSRPFFHSGIDYAGPFYIKTWRGKNARTYKGWVALFVCEATSAVHIELVTDYTTDAFMAAYKRFTSRRGICATLRSDCGTNFKGADAELQRLFQSSSKELNSLATLLANDGTQWRFNPPSAPHFGGKWEAGVKSVKYHLKRAVGEALLTYEEMTTLLTQIEAVLNSRPLNPLSEDSDDLNALTPGHFLIGSSLAIIPEPSLEEVKLSRLSRWQRTRQMMDSFWSRWSKECLQRYLTMSKWNQVNPSIKEGDLVLVVDERYPPSKWPLGRIIQTYPGQDGLTRVVSIRTQSSVLKRPIVKVCPLPIFTNE
ncbi:uncharacterized protein [Temnothorax nylanderi]|uniref:uncharacterized protein n=1 Tax=Temnothorax nylanderi TaxID=102681 RepID=UPI003A86A3D1